MAIRTQPEIVSALPDARHLLKVWVEHDWFGTKVRSKRLTNACLIRHSLDYLQDHLSQSLLERLERLLCLGWELRSEWPRQWNTRAWIGCRMFFAHARHFQDRVRFATVVCSQLGRDNQRLPHWPELLEAALRDVTFRNESLLIVPQTTLADACVAFAKGTRIKTGTVVYPPNQTSVENWLAGCLVLNPGIQVGSGEPILVSPDLDARRSPSDQGSIQDALAFALADQIYALQVRCRGRIERCVQQRLRQPGFPAGSIYIYLEAKPQRTRLNQRNHTLATNHQRHLSLLDQGAVGWYLTSTRHRATLPVKCCSNGENQLRAVQQLCAPLAALNTNDANWPFLTHCTRGTSGPLPGESKAAYQSRLRIAGRVADTHPLVALYAICQEQKLRASSRWTRSSLPSISFSEVPLLELFKRRIYRSHLGRWDWEPYGLLFNRRSLLELGARPVIYGTELDYARLPADAQSFFQPVGDKQDWSREREWRLLGDLDLSHPERGAITLFTRTRTEAHALAKTYAWPVLWLE